MRVYSHAEWHQQSQLLSRRERLQGLLEGLRVAAKNRADYEPHDVTDDEAAIQADAIEGRLAAIDVALGRIDEGGYGICVGCGSPIEDERLRALPATTVCHNCAR